MLDLFRTLPAILHDVEGAEMVREAVVFAARRRVAGDALSEHVVPIKFKERRLRVAVSSLTWQRHLKDLCGQMLFKLNAALGEPMVNFIDLDIDEQTVLEHRARDRSSREFEIKEAEKEITPELEQAAAKIEDEELRKQFLAAAGNCLVRRAHRSSGLAAR